MEEAESRGDTMTPVLGGGPDFFEQFPGRAAYQHVINAAGHKIIAKRGIFPDCFQVCGKYPKSCLF